MRAGKNNAQFDGPSAVKVQLRVRLVAGGGGCLRADCCVKRVASRLPLLKKKRRKFDLKDKAKIVDVARENGTLAAARLANNTAGFESVSARMVRKWRRDIDGKKPKARRGRKGTSDGFNAAVLGELVFASVEYVDNAQRLKVEANVAYTHVVIRTAARQVQKWPQFAQDKKEGAGVRVLGQVDRALAPRGRLAPPQDYHHCKTFATTRASASINERDPGEAQGFRAGRDHLG